MAHRASGLLLFRLILHCWELLGLDIGLEDWDAFGLFFGYVSWFYDKHRSLNIDLDSDVGCPI